VEGLDSEGLGVKGGCGESIPFWAELAVCWYKELVRFPVAVVGLPAEVGVLL
jgi:hypothetical protein